MSSEVLGKLCELLLRLERWEFPVIELPGNSIKKVIEIERSFIDLNDLSRYELFLLGTVTNDLFKQVLLESTAS